MSLFRTSSAALALGIVLVTGCTSNGLPIGCSAPGLNADFIQRAAECGASKASMARYVEAGDDINNMDVFGNRPLHLAADDATMRNLISLGADPAMLSGRGQTPLHHVAANQSDFTPAIVEFLLAAGVPINAADSEGNTALHVTAKRLTWRSNDMSRALIAAGANINAQNRDGNTPLHLAIIGTSSKEIDTQDAVLGLGSFGLTIAYRFSQDGLGRGALNMITLLIEQGADTSISNNDGLTPSAIADKKNPSVMKLLAE